MVDWKSAASDGRNRKVRSIPKANFSGTPSRAKATPKSDGAMEKATGKPSGHGQVPHQLGQGEADRLGGDGVPSSGM